MADGTQDADALERLIECLGDAAFVVSPSARVRAANRPAQRLYGLDASEFAGLPVGDLCAQDSRFVLEAEITAADHLPSYFSAAQRAADGRVFVGDFSARVCRELDMDDTLLVVRPRVASPHTAEDRALHTTMLDFVVDGIVCHTVEGDLVYANRNALKHWTDPEVPAGTEPFGWIPGPERALFAASMLSLRPGGGSTRFESRSTDKRGLPQHTEINSALVDTDRGPIVISSLRDISERAQTEEMVRHLAYHDMLTGLANRAMLDDQLERAVVESNRYGDHLGLIFIDIDAFKPINDSFGHAVGDMVLREVAKRISNSVREADTVARFGGDEFVVLLPRVANGEDLVTIALKLSKAIEAPIAVAGRELRVTSSLGMALREPDEDGEALLIRADLAMYEARERQLTGWELFSRTLP